VCETAWIPQPTERHADLLDEILALPGVHANLVPDAHLAALALERGLTLCSTDRDQSIARPFGDPGSMHHDSLEPYPRIPAGLRHKISRRYRHFNLTKHRHDLHSSKALLRHNQSFFANQQDVLSFFLWRGPHCPPARVCRKATPVEQRA